MLNKLLISLILGLVLISCSNNNRVNVKNEISEKNLIVNNELTDNKIKGKVSVISIFKYTVVDKSGEIQKGELLKSKEMSKYDIRGNTIESIEYDSDGLLSNSFKKTNEYDVHGNCIVKTIYQTNGTLITLGRLLFDRIDNKLKSIKNYNPDGSFKSEWKFNYDENGFKNEFSTYESNGNMTDEFKYINDMKGNMLEVSVFDSIGKIVIKIKSKYDENGNETENSVLRPDGTLSKLTTYKYLKFDNIGNWISRCEYQGGKPLFITEREILYYE